MKPIDVCAYIESAEDSEKNDIDTLKIIMHIAKEDITKWQRKQLKKITKGHQCIYLMLSDCDDL